MADCPSLMQYDALYGCGSSEYWIDIQVSGIFGASNSKEKGVADGIRIFCQSFASQVKAYKLSCGIEADPNDSMIHTYNKLHPAECGIFERLIKRRADIGMDEIQ